MLLRPSHFSHVFLEFRDFVFHGQRHARECSDHFNALAVVSRILHQNLLRGLMFLFSITYPYGQNISDSRNVSGVARSTDMWRNDTDSSHLGREEQWPVR